MSALVSNSRHSSMKKVKAGSKKGPKKVTATVAVPSPYVRVYLDLHTYWTVGVNQYSTAREVCASVAQKLERSEDAFELHDLEVKSGEDKMLRDDDLILMIQNSWGTREHRLIVKEIIGFSPLKATREFLKKEAAAESKGANQRLSLSVQQLQKLTGIPDEWAIDPVNLEIIEKISGGASSRVFRGKLRNIDVALKVMRASSDEDYTEIFQKELLICTAVKDPNVVRFFGACLLPPAKICLVMEYCSRGNLYTVMKENIYFGWDMFFRCAIGATRGINALHSWNPVIVHRDIKTQNLLLCENWDLKVCDFGLSRTTQADNLASLGKLRGTYTYCPPEIYFGQSYTSKSDIFSLGLVLWEMVARCIYGVHNSPFSEFKDSIDFEFQVFIRTAKDELRPTIPPTCPPGIGELIFWMWQADGRKRPNSLQVLDKLSILHKEYTNNKLLWDKILPHGPSS